MVKGSTEFLVEDFRTVVFLFVSNNSIALLECILNLMITSLEVSRKNLSSGALEYSWKPKGKEVNKIYFDQLKFFQNIFLTSYEKKSFFLLF